MRSDTDEYLCRFLFFDQESMTWTKDLDEALSFNTHSDAECNARLILDRLDDPVNRRVGLKCAKAAVKDGELVVSDWYPVNVILVS
jgi:cell shape-determining protein MreC